MSNRTLIIAIIVIIVVAVGIVIIGRSKNNSDQYNQPNNSAMNDNTNNANAVADANLSANTNQANNSNQQTNSTASDCKSDFDSSKLQTAKVDIANKFVTMTVKGFGQFKIQLYDKDAPKTVENFLRLVNAGFYDCLTFHRVAKGFVIQGGDPNGDGSGGITASGQALVDELNTATPSYKAGYVKGVLAMAKTSAPNSGTSQFFITLADDNKVLSHDYPIFGKIVSGQDVVDKIGAVPITPVSSATDGTPQTAVVITKAVITSK